MSDRDISLAEQIEWMGLTESALKGGSSSYARCHAVILSLVELAGWRGEPGKVPAKEPPVAESEDVKWAEAQAGYWRVSDEVPKGMNAVRDSVCSIFGEFIRRMRAKEAAHLAECNKIIGDDTKLALGQQALIEQKDAEIAHEKQLSRERWEDARDLRKELDKACKDGSMLVAELAKAKSAIERLKVNKEGDDSSYYACLGDVSQACKVNKGCPFLVKCVELVTAKARITELHEIDRSKTRELNSAVRDYRNTVEELATATADIERLKQETAVPVRKGQIPLCFTGELSDNQTMCGSCAVRSSCIQVRNYWIGRLNESNPAPAPASDDAIEQHAKWCEEHADFHESHVMGSRTQEHLRHIASLLRSMNKPAAPAPDAECERLAKWLEESELLCSPLVIQKFRRIAAILRSMKPVTRHKIEYWREDTTWFMSMDGKKYDGCYTGTDPAQWVCDVLWANIGRFGIDIIEKETPDGKAT